MGVLFEDGDELIWNPSPRLARLFVGQVRALEELTSAHSGIGPIIGDEVQVNRTQLHAFVAALAAEWEADSSATLKTLVAGPFAIATGILAACDESLTAGLEGAAHQLGSRGAALVSGRGRVGPIFDGLSEAQSKP